MRCCGGKLPPCANSWKKLRNKEARREERAQQAAQQSAAEGEADKAE